MGEVVFVHIEYQTFTPTMALQQSPLQAAGFVAKGHNIFMSQTAGLLPHELVNVEYIEAFHSLRSL